jgi:hypothetical protein
MLDPDNVRTSLCRTLHPKNTMTTRFIIKSSFLKKFQPHLHKHRNHSRWRRNSQPGGYRNIQGIAVDKIIQP